MKRILIAGGCGFIGSHLTDRLLRRNDIEELVIVDNLWTGRRENVAHVDDPRVRLIVADVESVVLDGLFDEIYNLASPASPPWYMAEPL